MLNFLIAFIFTSSPLFAEITKEEFKKRHEVASQKMNEFLEIQDKTKDFRNLVRMYFSTIVNESQEIQKIEKSIIDSWNTWLSKVDHDSLRILADISSFEALLKSQNDRISSIESKKELIRTSNQYLENNLAKIRNASRFYQENRVVAQLLNQNIDKILSVSVDLLASIDDSFAKIKFFNHEIPYVFIEKAKTALLDSEIVEISTKIDEMSESATYFQKAHPAIAKIKKISLKAIDFTLSFSYFQAEKLQNEIDDICRESSETIEELALSRTRKDGAIQRIASFCTSIRNNLERFLGSKAELFQIVHEYAATKRLKLTKLCIDYPDSRECKTYQELSSFTIDDLSGLSRSELKNYELRWHKLELIK